MDVTAKHKVFHSGHPGEKLNVLERPGDPFLGNLVRLEPNNIFTLEKDFPGIRLIESTDAVKDSRLTGTIGSDNRKYCAAFHTYRYSIYSH
jgi:hypothetical protein